MAPVGPYGRGMRYGLKRPCAECPFLKGSPLNESLSKARLREFAEGEFACHKTAELRESSQAGVSEYVGGEESQHCAGALIALERAGRPHQMMRIMERLGMYDRRGLDPDADVDVDPLG